MSVAKRTSPPGLTTRASAATIASETIRRLLCRRFGQGSGIEKEDPGKEGVRRGLDQRLRVAATQPDVGESFPFDACQSHGDAVEKRLAADQADVRDSPSPARSDARRAEADLEPEAPCALTAKSGAPEKAAGLDLELRAGSRPSAAAAQRAAPCRDCARRGCAVAVERSSSPAAMRRPCSPRLRRGGAGCRP